VNKLKEKEYLTLNKQEIVNYAGGSYGIRIAKPFFEDTTLKRNSVYDVYFYHKKEMVKRLSLATIKMGTTWGIRIPKTYFEQMELLYRIKYDIKIDLNSKR
jgi:hypothetical protein